MGNITVNKTGMSLCCRIYIQVEKTDVGETDFIVNKLSKGTNYQGIGMK